MAFSVEAADDIEFEYQILPINEIQVKEVTSEKGSVISRNLIINGEEIVGSDRFWTSLFAKYGFNKAFFKYFTPAEVCERIHLHCPDDKVRVCIERGAKSPVRALAVSNPERAIVVFDELCDLLESNGSTNVKYANGIVTSMQTPQRNMPDFSIAGDAFKYQFCMSTPLDGYGAPNIYLAMLRFVCQNGLIAHNPTFKSEVKLGKKDEDIPGQIVRALDSFNNEEGFLALRSRLESATKSWASVYEANSFYELASNLFSKKRITNAAQIDPNNTTLARALQDERFTDGDDDSVIGSQVLRAYHNMTGDLNHIYGLANLEALSVKRQRTLPTKTTIYDLLNLTTEVATHYAIPEASMQLQTWGGNLIAGEFDMEGTKDKFSDFADFHMETKLNEGLTGSHPELN